MQVEIHYCISLTLQNSVCNVMLLSTKTLPTYNWYTYCYKSLLVKVCDEELDHSRSVR